MNDYSFGNYLCTLRKSAGYSQKALAAKLHVSDKAVSKWENGRSKPQNKTLSAIAKLFGVSVDELLSEGKRVPRKSGIALSPAAFSGAAVTQSSEEKKHLNFIPPSGTPCYDYLCTWAMQEATAGKIGLHSGDNCTDQRDAITDELLFGSERYYHLYDRTYRTGLYLLLDDGWDVPFGSENKPEVNRFFGTCDPHPDKFPGYGATPVERLRTLNNKAKALGYAGVGLWIATETGGSGRGDLGEGREARRYWAERASWCERAGIAYWKIDWGKHYTTSYRRMLTEVLRENAPHIIVEHAFCQPPYSQMGDIECRRRDTSAVLPISDVFRLYDVVPPLKNSSMLMRIDEALSASIGMRPLYHTKGILNAETCSSICAAFGCSIGIMGEEQNDTSDGACLRWHRLAPPFSVYETDYKKSEARLTDTYFFDRRPSWWIDVRGKTFEESAPAIMARGCELPEVTPVGEVVPFVVASRNPKTGAYAIATIKRTIDPNTNIIGTTDIVFRVGGFDAPVGVFGYYNRLTLVFDQPIGKARVYVQDLMADEARDVTGQCTIDGSRVTFAGNDMRIFGTYSRMDDDRAEPSFLVKIAQS